MPSTTIAALLMARAHDDHPGLRTLEREWAWHEVIEECGIRATLLRSKSRHPERGLHVGILLPNVPEFIFWIGAAALSGCTIVGINSTKRGEGLASEIRHTECDLIITDLNGRGLLAGLDTGVAPEEVYEIDSPAYRELLADVARTPASMDPEVTPETRMLLLLTSGTTGRSKAAICSQGRLAALGEMNRTKYTITRQDVCYCPMPLFHGNALMSLLAPALTVGATIALTERFSASRFLPEVRQHRATFFTYVGKAISYVLATDPTEHDLDNRLTHAFGTEASPEDRARFLERFGCELIEGYGSSEGAGSIARAPDAPVTAMGRPAHEGIAIVHPQQLTDCAPARVDRYGRVTNPDEAIGEMVNKTGAAAFEGYWNDPAANAERVRHGWYWTGDLGYIDEQGFIYFAGRSGDWIRVDGENISSLQIERIIRRHRDVLAAAVFAVPDPQSGDQVMVALETAEQVDFEDLALPAVLAAQEDLGTKGAPRFVRHSHKLPTTGSNKLSKTELRYQGWRCDDPVYRWEGRGEPRYELMSEADKADLIAEFHRNGRERFLA